MDGRFLFLYFCKMFFLLLLSCKCGRGEIWCILTFMHTTTATIIEAKESDYVNYLCCLLYLCLPLYPQPQQHHILPMYWYSEWAIILYWGTLLRKNKYDSELERQSWNVELIQKVDPSRHELRLFLNSGGSFPLPSLTLSSFCQHRLVEIPFHRSSVDFADPVIQSAYDLR